MFSEYIDAAEHDYYCSDCGDPADVPGTGETCIVTGRCKECWWQASQTRLITENGAMKTASAVWIAHSSAAEQDGEVVLYPQQNDDAGEVFISGLDSLQVSAFVRDCEAAVMQEQKRFDARGWKARHLSVPTG